MFTQKKDKYGPVVQKLIARPALFGYYLNKAAAEDYWRTITPRGLDFIKSAQPERPEKKIISELLSFEKYRPKISKWNKIKRDVIDLGVLLSNMPVSGFFVGIIIIHPFLLHLVSDNEMQKTYKRIINAGIMYKRSVFENIVMDIHKKCSIISILVGFALPFIIWWTVQMAKLIKTDLIDPIRTRKLLDELDATLND